MTPVTWIEGPRGRIRLPTQLGALLACFNARPDMTVTTNTLLAALCETGSRATQQGNLLRVQILRLRRKLKQIGRPERITTIQGFGYRLMEGQPGEP